LGNKNDNSKDIEKYMNDGSLVIVDSLMTYLNPVQNSQIGINTIGSNNSGNKTNFLSLIGMVYNHGVKNNKKE
jgi:hypothetical protein